MTGQYYSTAICRAIAADFINESVDLANHKNDGIAYQIDGEMVTVREQSKDRDFQATPPVGTIMMRAATEDKGEVRVYRFPLVGFVGGVAYALAAKEVISPEDVNISNISGVCFELGKEIAKQEACS